MDAQKARKGDSEMIEMKGNERMMFNATINMR